MYTKYLKNISKKLTEFNVEFIQLIVRVVKKKLFKTNYKMLISQKNDFMT